jgi:hypothetical protein
MTALTSTASVQFDQGGPAEVAATVRLNGGSRIYCHLYEDSAPVLSITDAHVRMSVSVPDPDHVTAEDVSFGRLLAGYVAELEKLATAGAGEPSGRAA